MHQKKAPKKISMTEIIPKNKNINWNKYSHLHDSFLQELSYGERKPYSTDVWQLNYI